jgi:hypothetical protein
MHTGVRAARAVYVDILAGDVLQNMLYLALHRSDIRLYLPSTESGAVIFDFYEYVFSHQNRF